MSESVYITAEIGINHNGELELAKKLIDVAVVAGVSAVKFQKRNPEVCVPECQKSVMRQTPWGDMTYLEYRHRIEFQKNEYDEIERYCEERGIQWYTSIWDEDSLEFILRYDPVHLKIPSAVLTHSPLLEAVADTQIHTFIGTGMSTIEEIDRAVQIFKSKSCPFTLMHSNSSYPAKNEELNLTCIPEYKKRYNCPVGYSGHEFGLLPTVLAVVLGASSVERHITMNRSMVGSDHLASVEPIGLMKLVSYIRTAQTVMGDGVKKVYESELSAMKKLRYFE